VWLKVKQIEFWKLCERNRSGVFPNFQVLVKTGNSHVSRLCIEKCACGSVGVSGCVRVCGRVCGESGCGGLYVRVCVRVCVVVCVGVCLVVYVFQNETLDSRTADVPRVDRFCI